MKKFSKKIKNIILLSLLIFTSISVCDAGNIDTNIFVLIKKCFDDKSDKTDNFKLVEESISNDSNILFKRNKKDKNQDLFFSSLSYAFEYYAGYKTYNDDDEYLKKISRENGRIYYDDETHYKRVEAFLNFVQTIVEQVSNFNDNQKPPEGGF